MPRRNLNGLRVLVTGASQGIGRALCVVAAKKGCKVLAAARSRPLLDELAAEVRAAGGTIETVVADVTQPADRAAMADAARTHFGGLDVLINNAGIGATGHFADATGERLRKIFEVNFFGLTETTRVCLPLLKQGNRPAILNISSMASMRAISGVLGYSVAKAGIDSFTRWLAVEMARKHGDGIRVNAIAPGFFVSEQNRAVLLNPDGSYTARASTIIAHTPMGRLGRPDELNAAVQWLCSDSASFVTGVVLPIDGGFSAFSGV